MRSALSGAAEPGSGPRRVSSALLTSARTTLASAARVLHLLFLQITGLFFLFFAVGFGYAAWHEYQAWNASHANGARLSLVSAFTLLFAWFGASSFWRASQRPR